MHPEFELTFDMMTGIRTTVGMVESKPYKKKVQKSDYEEAIKMKFPAKGSMITPAHPMRDFKFKDYAPEIFRHIRARFGIDPADYLMCVCGNFNYLEFISNSKSGQFFFYSYNMQYMIKTVSADESKFLRKILPAYYDHIMANPNTLMTRFYGMHRVKPARKKEVHFLIMGSVFYGSNALSVTYDLKGSKQGRNATAKEKASGSCVYKDNDLLEMGAKIVVGPERAKQLNEQITSDVEFLRKLNIMDYSLLLGITKQEASDQKLPEIEENSEDERKFRALDTIDEAKADATDNTLRVPESKADRERSPTRAQPPVTRLHRAISTDTGLIDTTPRDRRQTYALPKRWNQFSSPQDHNLITLQFTSPVLPPKPSVPRHKQAGSEVEAVVSAFTRENGGLAGAGSGPKETYYMGIIDILTQYTTMKRLEHFGKSLRYDSHEISAVSPQEYAERFRKFLAQVIV